VSKSRPTVLIVEDNAITRAGLAAILDQHGYTVSTAPNGRVALDLLVGGPLPRLILLDMLMPDVDGWRFLDRLKTMSLWAVPVIVMSGVGLSSEWAAANGCFDFLRKPFDERDLLATVARALESTSSRPHRPSSHHSESSRN
jgi:CheY-like chemotaxis protein